MTVQLTTIVVVDDHQLFRAGLIELLQSVPGFTVKAEGGSGTDAVTLAAQWQPDVLLLDIEMPGPKAPETISRIHQVSPATSTVVLTMHDSSELLAASIDAGAAGYLVKTAGREDLVAAVSATRRIDGVVLVCVSRKSLLNLGRADLPRTSRRVDELLSNRESDVLRHLAHGGSNRDLAEALSISEGTVKRHLANIYAKLGATSRIDAVRKAADRGMIGLSLAD